MMPGHLKDCASISFPEKQCVRFVWNGKWADVGKDRIREFEAELDSFFDD